MLTGMILLADLMVLVERTDCCQLCTGGQTVVELSTSGQAVVNFLLVDRLLLTFYWRKADVSSGGKR